MASNRDKDNKIFIGHLYSPVSKEEIRTKCEQFGRVVDVSVPRVGPNDRGFAFVTFEDSRSVHHAVFGLNGNPKRSQREQKHEQKRQSGREVEKMKECSNNDNYRLRLFFPSTESGHRVALTIGRKPKTDKLAIHYMGLPSFRHSAVPNLRDRFERYGRLTDVWVARNPPGFAFVYFEDLRDAQDAVRALDGTRLGESRRVRVEIAHGKSRGEVRYSDDRRGERRGGGGRRSSRGRSRSRSRTPPRRTGRERASPTYSPARKEASRSPSKSRSRTP